MRRSGPGKIFGWLRIGLGGLTTLWLLTGVLAGSAEIGGVAYSQHLEANVQPCSELALTTYLPSLSTLTYGILT